MADPLKEVHGLTLKQWAASFRPGMAEYAASDFSFSGEAPDQVRIAFCNRGPFVDENGTRDPVYTHAVTLSPHIAVALAEALLKHYAKPDAERKLD